MTVNTLTNQINYIGNGVTVTFPYDFLVYDVNHMQVFLDGVLQSTGFTVNNTPLTSNGDVTFDAAPASNVQIILLRVVPLTQLIDYQPFDPFPAETHERGLDLGVMRDQQNQNADTQELRVPITDPQPGEVPTVSVRANKLLGFDSAGDPIVSDSDVDDVDALVASGLGSGALMSSFSYVGDGVIVAFVIAGVQINHAASIMAFIDGISQNPDVDYTVSDDGVSTTVTFTTAPPNLSDVRLHVVGFSKPVFNSTADSSLYLPHDNALGTVSRFVDDKLDELFSVRDFGAVGDGVTDDTAAFQAAIAASVAAGPFGGVRMTGGEYVISGQLTLTGIGEFVGEGSPRLLCDTAAHPGVFILCTGTNIRNVRLSGSGVKTAGSVGLRLEGPGGANTFVGNARLERIDVRGFDIGVEYDNVFGTSMRNALIWSNNKGLRMVPTNDAGDNGYYTTLSFYDVGLHDNTEYSIDCRPAISSRVMVFINCYAQNSGSSGYQCRFQNMQELVFTAFYGENAVPNTADLIEFVNCNIVINALYNNSGGSLEFGAGSNVASMNDIRSVVASDDIQVTGALARLDMFNCNFGADSVFTTTFYRAVHCLIAGVQYNYLVGGFGLAANSQHDPTIVMNNNYSFTGLVSGTINAGANTILVNNRASTQVWLRHRQAFASIQDSFQPDLHLVVTTANTGSQEFFSVSAYNSSNSNITLTNVTLNVFFMGGNAETI